MKMIEFLSEHNACDEGLGWASENCRSIRECWDKAKPDWLIWLATMPGVLTKRELHEFALWSANQVRHLLKDHRSIIALDIKRKWLDGEASDEKLTEARSAAMDAAMDAADAEWVAADEASAAAWYAARAAQAEWLRQNTKPNFKDEA